MELDLVPFAGLPPWVIAAVLALASAFTDALQPKAPDSSKMEKPTRLTIVSVPLRTADGQLLLRVAQRLLKYF